jgi:hypothetical protein
MIEVSPMLVSNCRTVAIGLFGKRHLHSIEGGSQAEPVAAGCPAGRRMVPIPDIRVVAGLTYTS